MSEPTPLDPETFGREQPCFGCSPTHPTGLCLTFEKTEDAVTTRWTPGEQHQGPPGILHGGLVTTMADELAAWTIVALKGRMGFTASLQGRLRRPIRVGREVTGVGRIKRDGSRVVQVAVVLSQDDEPAFEGEFTFAVLTIAGAERLLETPLPDAWRRFCRGADGNG